MPQLLQIQLHDNNIESVPLLIKPGPPKQLRIFVTPCDSLRGDIIIRFSLPMVSADSLDSGEHPLHADDSYYPHEIDHIIPKKHGGSNDFGNLALACFFCNRYKGSDIGSIDPLLKKFTKFFNPRIQKWN